VVGNSWWEDGGGLDVEVAMRGKVRRLNRLLLSRTLVALAAESGGAALAFAALAVAGPPALGPAPWTEEAAERGLTYSYSVLGGAAGWGLCFADLDGDGDSDLFAVGQPGGAIGLWENDGTGHFVSRAAASGIPLLTTTSSVLAFDADGDGDQDLWVGRWALTSKLYRNDGGFHFDDVTLRSGLGVGSTACTGAVVADVDGDGDLDLYAARFGQPNRLYLNNGSCVFTDIAVAAGVADEWNSWQAVFIDYDLDGDPDIYVSEDKKLPTITYMHNRLFRNDGAAKFTDVSIGSGTDVNAYSMGVGIGDLDRNGYDDLFCTNLAVEAAPLLMNQGNGAFLNQAIQFGVEYMNTAWGSVFFDFDNDSHLDLYVCNFLGLNRLYHNTGTPPMIDIAPEVNATLTGYSHCIAAGDIDGDGDIDLAVQEDGQPLRLLINHEGSVRHCVMIDVVGDKGNTAAIGARVSLRVGNSGATSWQHQSVLCGGNGFKGQNALRLHFGIGDATAADEVTIRWRDGVTRSLSSLPAGVPWRIVRPEQVGDHDGDGDRDLLDFVAMLDCVGGSLTPRCVQFDATGNSVVDVDDAVALLPFWTSPVPDCDGDGVPDPLQIAAVPSLDANHDGLLDGCLLLLGDLNYDGVVNAIDLAVLLAEWDRPTSPADLSDDGIVGGADLDMLLAGWTPGEF